MITRPRKPLIYIAGPLTAPDAAVNVQYAVRVANVLRDNLRVDVYIPHLSHFENLVINRPYEEWMAIDLSMLEHHCHAVYRMAGHSPGADREVAAARQWNLPVFFDADALERWVTLGCPAEG